MPDMKISLEPFVELDMDENRTVWKLYIPKGNDFEIIPFASREEAEEVAKMRRG
jgi:hypothetical protein